jgi:hypothetical protein
MSSITGVVHRVVMRNEHTCSTKDKVATKWLACVWDGKFRFALKRKESSMADAESPLTVECSP